MVEIGVSLMTRQGGCSSRVAVGAKGGAVRVGLLGKMEVCGVDGSPIDCGGAKQRAILAQLVLEANVAVGVDRLAEGVWGEQVPSRYRQNIQVYVSTLRRAIEPTRPRGAPSRLVGHGEGYEFIIADDEVDVARF